ncbi:MAG: hypothetical protein HC925_09765 [Coleofasciculaceae cyanobacterium SM2_3_26]|nr:hypothetical protein [Coleofasciculaceae cyanobacterium SM2_3_26]
MESIKRGRKPGYRGVGKFGYGVPTKVVRLPAHWDVDELVRSVQAAKAIAEDFNNRAANSSSPRYYHALELARQICQLLEEFPAYPQDLLERQARGR